MYTDYDFYITKYYGNVISETDFPKYEDKASDKLYQLTFGRIENVLATDNDSRLSVRIKKAVCAIAEKMYDVDQANNLYRQTNGMTEENGMIKGKVVKSVSAGAESISYSTQSDVVSSLQALSAMSDAQLRSVYFETARDYIGDTGLLSQAL